MTAKHTWGAALICLVVAALAGATLYFALTSRANRQSATSWRHHAQQSDRLLAARTHQLNARSTALNRVTEQLARSEGDVKQLVARQQTLANEKAQVEDQRGAMVVQASQLASLADEQRTCSDGLSRLLSEFAAGDYAAVQADASTVDADCATARTDFAAFQNQYGSG
jgi:septal ring factor EnvC (AmiA/AmiB activator)